MAFKGGVIVGPISLSSTGSSDIIIDSDDTLLMDADGVLEINSSAGAISIGNDANAQAINIGTGAAARTITIGNNTGATALNLDIGTGDYTLDSATGNIITALDTGEVRMPLQPAFLADLSASALNVTGAGSVYVLLANTEIFDQNSDYNNATGVFTAPITARYEFNVGVNIADLTVNMTASVLQLSTSNRNYSFGIMNVGASRALDGANRISMVNGFLTDMDAGDTAQVNVQVLNGAGDTADVSQGSKFAGFLAC